MGNIPPCLGNFTGLSYSSIVDISIMEVIKGDVLEYTKTRPFLVNVDLQITTCLEQSHNPTEHVPLEFPELPELVLQRSPREDSNRKPTPNLIDPSIYTGNQGLCGDPLPRKCKGGDNQPKLLARTAPAQEHEEDHENLWFYLVIAAGFTTGFWGVVGTLVVKKTRRHAYFKLVEDFFGRIYVQAEITKV
ncbi:hypothetical protein Droror1_Dr00002644 [Drosera rotundifolia]